MCIKLCFVCAEYHQFTDIITPLSRPEIRVGPHRQYNISDKPSPEYLYIYPLPRLFAFMTENAEAGIVETSYYLNNHFMISQNVIISQN